MGVMQLLSLKFSAGWFLPFQMMTLSYRRNFSRSVNTRMSHTYWRSAIHMTCWVWSCCNVSWQNHQCSTEVPSTSKANTEASLTWPKLHTPALTLVGQLPCLRVCLQRLFQERTLASQVSFQQEKPMHCSSGQPIKRYACSAWKKWKKADLIGVHTEEPPSDEIFPDNVCAPHTNEAYTPVHLPASASSKGMASLWVKIDTGTSGNVLSLHLFRHLYPDCIHKTDHPTGLNVSTTRLTSYIGTWIPLFGSLHGPIIWQPGSPSAQPCQINSCWYVADTPGPAILELPSCERLEVVKMNCAVKVIQGTSHLPGPNPVPATPKRIVPIKSTEDFIRKFPDRFQGIGQFPGEYTIRLHDNAQPVIHAPRKCPISIHPKVKAEVDNMVNLGVITSVDEPNNWVSSVAYAWKASGKVHICVDPCDLNDAICRDHHCTPTVDKVAHEFAHSKYFTKLDARHGYWAIILDSKSSFFTTFNTPYGSYCFLHLPFDLAYSQDVFQKRIDQILEECEGCIRIAHDITVHGCTEAEHDACLWELMEVAYKYGLVFNPKKTQVKAPMVKFFGCLYDESTQIQRRLMLYMPLPTPTNITEVQEFLDMATYLSPFIPGLFTLTAACVSYSRRMQISAGMPPTKQLFNVLRMLLLVTVPLILWCFMPNNSSSWCFTSQTWSWLTSRQQAHHLCQQGTDWSWISLCQHCMRDVSCYLQSWMVQELCLW